MRKRVCSRCRARMKRLMTPNRKHSFALNAIRRVAFDLPHASPVTNIMSDVLTISSSLISTAGSSLGSRRPKRLISAQVSHFIPRTRPKRPSALDVHLALLQRIVAVHLRVARRARASQYAIFQHARVVRALAPVPRRAHILQTLRALRRDFTVERIRLRCALLAFLCRRHPLRVVRVTNTVIRRLV